MVPARLVKAIRLFGRAACTLLALSEIAAASVPGAPSYTVDSIVHAATQTPEALAPNTIGTIYGTDLAFSTHAVTASDVGGGYLPKNIDGVVVAVGNITATLFYVSPTQINFLVPYELVAGTVTIYVSRQNLAGPVLKIQLNNTAPAFFPWTGNMAIAVHLSGALISSAAPATPGEIIVIYAAGLGKVSPDTASGRIVSSAVPIRTPSQLQVLLDGVPCPPGSVLYAGLAPGFAGLYQINLKLPPDLTSNPEIRVSVGTGISPPRIHLATVSAPPALTLQ